MIRPAAVLVAVMLGGCAPDPVDFTIDASDFASKFPNALLIADLAFDGETLEHAELDLSEASRVTFPGAIKPVADHGVAAYADMDADGLCDPTSDDVGWMFVYSPKPKVDFVWAPDPAIARDDAHGCAWFGGFGEDTDTDAGADSDTL